ncbi:MAG: aminotransferase class V-fold PLP-dependent enzyme [Bdellovibrionota bacterium]
MDLSALFTRDPSFFHLNAGTRSRVPLSVLDFIERERRESERNPTKSMFVGYDRIWSTQKELAAFLGADPHDLFLRHNVTAAFNDFLFALPRPESGEVLASGWEYGGIVGVARQWAKSAGLSYRTFSLPLGTDVTREALIAAAVKAISGDTRVLLLSHVATGTGAILPVEEIAAAARARGVITVIDGAHAVGSLPLRLGSLEADFYGGNFHKWFMGAEGTGFGWVNPRWAGKLDWKFGGWANESAPAFYQNFGDRRIETCRRFFAGTIDRGPFLSLSETLRFWNEQGAEKLRRHQTSLRDLALKEAVRHGWKPLCPADPALLGPLVCFARPAAWVGEATALATRILKEAKVQLALPEVQGVALVRLSPGAYATDSEVKQGVESAALFRP